MLNVRRDHIHSLFIVRPILASNGDQTQYMQKIVFRMKITPKIPVVSRDRTSLVLGMSVTITPAVIAHLLPKNIRINVNPNPSIKLPDSIHSQITQVRVFYHLALTVTHIPTPERSVKLGVTVQSHPEFL